MQIGDFVGRQSQAFRLVIFLQILHMLDGLWFSLHTEHVLPDTLVHSLQHGVVLGFGTGHGEELLDTQNAVEIHILRHLNGIRAPGRHHFTAWPHIKSLQLLRRHQRGVAIEPAQPLQFVWLRLVVNFRCNYGFLLRFKKKNHRRAIFM